MIVRYTQDSSILVNTFQNPPPQKCAKLQYCLEGVRRAQKALQTNRRTDMGTDVRTDRWPDSCQFILLSHMSSFAFSNFTLFQFLTKKITLKLYNFLLFHFSKNEKRITSPIFNINTFLLF